VLGSLHCIVDGDALAEPWELIPRYSPADVFRTYLREIPRVVAGSDAFSALAHIDYPLRSWPKEAAPFDPHVFEDDLRDALRALARGKRALEINTRLPLHPKVLRWWREEGGRTVTLGSDAHTAHLVGNGLAEAGQVARTHGFTPGAAGSSLDPSRALMLRQAVGPLVAPLTSYAPQAIETGSIACGAACSHDARLPSRDHPSVD